MFLLTSGPIIQITSFCERTPFVRCLRISIYIILRQCLDNMKAERLLLTMIVAAAILVTPSVLTSPVLAQGTADEEDGNQGTTGGGADDESPEDMYQTFQTCLEAGEEGAGGAGAFATEDEIRDCFIEAGYVPGTDDDNDEEENEGDDEETNN